MEVDTSIIILVLLTSITAYLIKGLVGFGPSLIIVPVLSAFLDFRTAVAIASLADVVSSGLLYFKERKKVSIRRMSIILSGMLVGTFIGVNMFSYIPGHLLQKLFGVYLIFVAIKSFVVKSEKTIEYNKYIAMSVGVLAGILGGITNVNGPPIVMYLKSITEDKRNLRPNLSFIFFFDAVWRTSLLWSEGHIGSFVVSIFGLSVLPGMIFGLYLGEQLLKRINSKTVSSIIEFLLLATGGGMLFR